MEKDRFMELIRQRQIGERVRVLFDMLMELINAQPDIEKKDFWEGIKKAFEGEQKAMEELMKRPDLEEKSRSGIKTRKKKTPKEEDRGVVVDILKGQEGSKEDTEEDPVSVSN